MSQLFKQKYFCQICDRQCRDKDGFICHMNSNTHKLNMERVAQNPEEYINNYSFQFEKDFLDVLKRLSHSSYISANRVYQEYITDKTATHMNATRWSTLTDFIKNLQQRGKIEIKEQKDLKDILIKLVDIDPDKRLLNERKINHRKTEEIKLQKEFKKIRNLPVEESEKSQINLEKILSSTDESKILGKIEFSFKSDSKKNVIKKTDFLQKKRNKTYDSEIDSDYGKKKDERKEISISSINSEKIFIDVINHPWISKNLMVKINDPKIPSLNNKIGIIKRVIDDFLAEVEIIQELKETQETNETTHKENPTLIRIDQAYLLPTILSPSSNISSQVKILFGENKNEICQLVSVDHEFAYVILKDDKQTKIKIDYLCSMNNN
jgi:DNA/RNA-binding protein KIN17